MTSVECPPFSVSVSFYDLSLNRVSGRRADERADLWHRGSSEAISLGSFSQPSTMPPRLRNVEWGRPSTSVGDPERFDAQAGSLDGRPFVASQQHVPPKPSTRRF